MQNEITELRNQVRTLKRIVYGFGCLLVVLFSVGCNNSCLCWRSGQQSLGLESDKEYKVLVVLSNGARAWVNKEHDFSVSYYEYWFYGSEIECVEGGVRIKSGNFTFSHNGQYQIFEN